MIHFLRISLNFQVPSLILSPISSPPRNKLLLNSLAQLIRFDSRQLSSDGKKIACKFEAVRLTSRSLLNLKGADTHQFLQGLITNDISHFESKPAIYALFLNSQGRVLWDTILFNVGVENEPSVLVECDNSIKANLIKHLRTFKLRKKVEIIDVQEDKQEDPLEPWVVFDHGHITLAQNLMKEECCGEAVVPTSKRADLPVSIDQSLRSFGDPRLSELGWRILVPKSKSESFPPKDIEISDEASYTKLRYVLGVAEGAKEIPAGSSFPLESNGDYLHGVSFHKGCYIGQELTARTHHTGVIRKRIMPIRFPEGVNLDSVDPSTLDLVGATTSSRSLGKIRGVCGTTGIGLIRIEEATSASDLKIKGYSVSVEKPFWWPKEASREKQSKQ